MSGSIIISCSCRSDFQDKQYGKGRRLANLTKTEANAHCTVCSRTVVSGKAALSDKKKQDKADKKE